MNSVQIASKLNQKSCLFAGLFPEKPKYSKENTPFREALPFPFVWLKQSLKQIA